MRKKCTHYNHKFYINFNNYYMFRYEEAILRGSQIERSTSTNTSAYKYDVIY